MGYLADDLEDPVEIPGAGGATVTFHPVATFADECELGARMEFARERANGNRAQEIAAFGSERAAIMIAAWTLCDRAGEPLPVTAEVIAHRLPRSVARWLLDEARLRYDGRPEDQEAPFVKPSGRPSSDTT